MFSDEQKQIEEIMGKLEESYLAWNQKLMDVEDLAVSNERSLAIAEEELYDAIDHLLDAMQSAQRHLRRAVSTIEEFEQLEQEIKEKEALL